jgi:Ca2+-transporting ATPase
MGEVSWHTMDPDAALKALETDPQKGLGNDETQRRIDKYGYNELKQEERISPFTILISQFKNILMIILIFAIALSALMGELVDAAIILVIVIFCAVLGFIQEYRA